MRTHCFPQKPIFIPSRPHRPDVRPYAAPAVSKARANVRHILRGPALQTKLTIGAPDDIYEQEADRVADEVMRMPEPRLQAAPTCNAAVCPRVKEETLKSKPLADQITPLVQRQVEEEEEEELLQTKPAVGHTPEAIPRVASAIAAMQGGGQPLPASERDFFEPRFGRDFSQVRIHTDAPAAESARAVKARALTVGRDVVFGAGEYAPDSASAKRLLAHELVHVVQQGGHVPGESQPTRTPQQDDSSEPDVTDRGVTTRREYTAHIAPVKDRQTDLLQRAAPPEEAGLPAPLPEEGESATAPLPLAGGAPPSCPIQEEGTLSEVSWGETGGLAPIEASAKDDHFTIEKWDPVKTCQLLKARGAVHTVSSRGETVHRGSPGTNPLEQKLKRYHLIENFPTAHTAVESDAEVKWFYLSEFSDKPYQHPGVPSPTERVMTYGSFHNIGKGDAPKGAVYIHFYRLKGPPSSFGYPPGPTIREGLY